MAHVTLTLEEYEALRSLISSERESEGATLAAAPPKKKRRKVSKYSKEFGIQLKKLIKKHPRSKVTQLMAQAHVKTRKAMK
jgi:hypothetical protein